MEDYSVEELDLSNKELTELPDLTRYTKLKKLNNDKFCKKFYSIN